MAGKTLISIITLALASAVAPTMVGQQTSSDKSAEQLNRQSEQADSPGATLEVLPGSPTIKTKDIVHERKITPWLRLPRYIVRDQKAIWTSPFHTDKANAKWWLIFGGVGAAFIASDHWTSRQLPNTNSQVSVANWTSKFGGAPFLLPASGAFYFAGLAADNQRFRETGILGFEALANTEFVVIVAKAITHRARPLEGDGKGGFWSSQGSLWNSGFPSGHAINSWALASVIAHEYPHPLIIPITVYGLSSLVVGSRFAARKHFASDVVIGGAMGWFIGDYVFAKRHNRDFDKPSAIEKLASHLRIGGPETPAQLPRPEAEKAAALKSLAFAPGRF
jgi:membrane-associated phospholipid phosphatase